MSWGITDRIAGFLARAARILVFLFMVGPLFFVLLMSINPQVGVFPPHAISATWYQFLLSRSDFRDGLTVSLLLGLSVTLMAVVIGTLCAFPLARVRFMGRNVLTVIFLSPLIVPEIASAVALLNFFVLIGVISNRFESLLIGLTIIAVPYVIRVVTGSLVGFDRSLEESSLNLGASWAQTTMKITLPLIRPSLLAGALFAFQASFTNVTISIFLSSADVTPLPVVLFSWMRFSFNPSLAAISTLLMVFTTGLIFTLEKLLGLDKLVGVTSGFSPSI